MDWDDGTWDDGTWMEWGWMVLEAYATRSLAALGRGPRTAEATLRFAGARNSAPPRSPEHMAKRKALWEQKNNARKVCAKMPAVVVPRNLLARRPSALARARTPFSAPSPRGEKIAPDVLKAVMGTKAQYGAVLG
jgi:hypothetical protein